MKESGSGALVLVVDDDSVARHLVTRLLEKAGYAVVTESSAESAKAVFESRGAANFECIVTDYQMPGANGVDLVASVRMQDPNIAAILVTAEGEQQLVEQSLRAGFTDFLNKPVSSADLLSAVTRAATATRRMREIADLTRNVEQAGLTQKRLLTSEMHKGLLGTEVYRRPIHQAGGDFFSHIQVSPTDEVILIADVSGHDLSAAYISAYFQGMVRGMLESGQDMNSVLQRFNRFLIEESETQSESGSVSISACGLHFSATSNEVTVVNCGAPLAVFVSPSRGVEGASESPSYPLGWFADNPIVPTRHVFAGGEFIFWTDGLSDLATLMNASPLSLVHGLLAAKPCDPEPSWLARAADDIMAARIQRRGKPEDLHLVLDEAYGPEQESNINELQQYWKNSILAAACRSELQEECACLYDAMLCAREALLNAIRYGCRAGETARFQVSCRADVGMLRVHVSDPGAGHSFDGSIHDESVPELSDLHRGLMLIRALCGQMVSERNGAELTMDFFWKETLQ
jgi:CheY-like chemotaxis protein/anti-sigma regulatory factor (Ser/Thr protein kinase)